MADLNRYEGAPRLQFEFKHEGPLGLSDFAHAMSRLDGRYRRKSGRLSPEAEQGLLITQIHPGSTVVNLIDLLPVAQATVQAIGGIHTLFEFGRDVSGLRGSFRQPKQSPSELTIRDCDDARALVKPAITAEGGGLIINIVGDNNIVSPIFQASQQSAREIDNRAALVRAELQQQAELDHRNVLLTWYQVRDAPGAQEGKPTPDQGIIHSINPSALPVRFAAPEAKEAMIGGEDNPFYRGYIVDVRVLWGPHGPTAYLVTRFIDSVPLDSAA